MKTIQNNNSKILVASIAIAISTISMESVQAKEEKVHEIGWSSRLSGMGLNKLDNLNKKFTFYCQPAADDLIHAPIWGTSNYTTKSGICSAAVHGGMIHADEGGQITIKLQEGQSFYTGSYKNKVTSQDNRSSDISFTFTGKTLAEQKKAEETSQENQSLGIKKVMVNSVLRGVERSIENTITDLFK